ncbi:hypothetical protein CPB84DRAFT_622562 [Gymnopilus junonius]|uniref:Uncharacterized protein n=1 Tax=Gymnopilus junonius TaxID=109634 RepID=A0A9P5N930_GYMJU|nr:hypothetical protein CPB84DRAFT_622562 [Gymnopilus junonius]
MALFGMRTRHLIPFCLSFSSHLIQSILSACLHRVKGSSICYYAYFRGRNEYNTSLASYSDGQLVNICQENNEILSGRGVDEGLSNVNRV